MRLYKIDLWISGLVEESMKNWYTTLRTNGEVLADIKIKCEIFQGDALSPLLFCVALIPLSSIIEQTGHDYMLKSEQKIHHLLYVDGLKLYARNE